MTYPDNPITVGQTLQRAIDRIMQQTIFTTIPLFGSFC